MIEEFYDYVHILIFNTEIRLVLDVNPSVRRCLYVLLFGPLALDSSLIDRMIVAVCYFNRGFPYDLFSVHGCRYFILDFAGWRRGGRDNFLHRRRRIVVGRTVDFAQSLPLRVEKWVEPRLVAKMCVSSACISDALK